MKVKKYLPIYFNNCTQIKVNDFKCFGSYLTGPTLHARDQPGAPKISFRRSSNQVFLSQQCLPYSGRVVDSTLPYGVEIQIMMKGQIATYTKFLMRN